MFSERLQALQAELPHGARLLAVSKTATVAQIREAHAAGLDSFGESYWPAAAAKIMALRDLALTWMFIGRLQGNKCKVIAEHFDWVLSLSHWRHAERLNAARAAYEQPLNVCVQIHGGPQKDGMSLSEVPDFIQAIVTLPHLRLRGLMVLPDRGDTAVFTLAAALFHRLQPALPADFDTLSMGMSDDYHAALAAGSNLIRIGSLLFK